MSNITIISEGKSMKKLSRREAMRTIGAAGAGVTLAGMTEAAAQIPAAPAFRGQHQIKPLPFDPAKLNGISEKLIRSHHENNYSGAVRALNAVEQRLDAMMKDKDLPAYVYGDLKREELVRTGSLTLHEIYFANLGGGGKAAGDGYVRTRVSNGLRRGGGEIRGRVYAKRQLGRGQPAFHGRAEGGGGVEGLTDGASGF